MNSIQFFDFLNRLNFKFTSLNFSTFSILREKMKTETLEKVIANNSWESLLLVEVNTKKNRHLEGKYSHEGAAKSKKIPMNSPVIC